MDTAIETANERMVYVTGDKEAIRAYERRQMALSDYTSSMNYAREEGHRQGMRKGMREGIKEGMKEGIAKSTLEIAQKMKNAGRPLSEIQEFTGLPIETITQL